MIIFAINHSEKFMENILENLLKYKKSNQWVAEKMGVSIDELIKMKKDLKISNSPKITQEIVESTGDKKITISSSYPLSPKEINELAGVDGINTIVQRTWLKSHANGNWTYSINVKYNSLDTSLEKQKKVLLEEIKNHKFKPDYNIFTQLISSKTIKEKQLVEGCLLEISIPDIHIGKLSHDSETGESYDLKIAAARWKAAVSDILSRVNLGNVERILLPVGNDLIHIDNENNTTFMGTPQDCDSRFSKMVKTAKELLVNTINELSAIAPVDVLIVRGNHDSTVTFLLGEVLEAWFHSNKNVNIENSPKWRKYYQYGKNGFQYTHGDKEPHKELGLIFATEQAKLWADTEYRIVKLGHLHKQKKMEWVSVDSYQGFQVQILPSLSSADEWHYSKGYLSLKQAKGFLYHKTKGLIAEYTHTV